MEEGFNDSKNFSGKGHSVVILVLLAREKNAAHESVCKMNACILSLTVTC